MNQKTPEKEIKAELRFSTQILLINHKIYVCGAFLNVILEHSSEVWQTHSTDEAFETNVKSFVAESYFKLISFTHLPLKIVVGLPLMNGDVKYVRGN